MARLQNWNILTSLGLLREYAHIWHGILPVRAELYEIRTAVGLFYQLMVDLFVIYFSTAVVLSEDYLISCIFM